MNKRREQRIHQQILRIPLDILVSPVLHHIRVVDENNEIVIIYD